MNRVLAFVILPLVVICYYILVAYPYFASKINQYDSLGFLSVVEEVKQDIKKTNNQNRKTDPLDKRLLKGEKVAGKITPSENNFGILLFRFDRTSSIVKDSVVFRIKKDGEKSWFYENTYKADQFQPNEYFTFGFPLVQEAKNNTYAFEIESQNGTYASSIGLSTKKPQVALVYKYNKDDLKNYNILLPFVYKKFVYAANNAKFSQIWQLLGIILLAITFALFLQNKKKLPSSVANKKLSSNKSIKSQYLLYEKKSAKTLKKISSRFVKSSIYSTLFNTVAKKRLAVGLLIFLFALTYRFAFSLVNLDKMFYAGLGGQGDYDQFVRASTCALNFCEWILHQNLLIQSTILGTFYKLFGFFVGLKIYAYLMMTMSALVATIPYFLLSRKNWLTVGGIIGSLFLATNDFLSAVALNYPPDNGSTFFFSIFFIVYLLTIHIGTLRWLIGFGLVGFFDGMYKALFLINDLVALGLFAPVYIYEKLKAKSSSLRVLIPALLTKKNRPLLLQSVIPVSIFLILYSAWELFLHLKFNMYYFLRGLLLTGGESYVMYTSFDKSSVAGNTLVDIINLFVSGAVMVKRVVEYADLTIFMLFSIYLALLYFSFANSFRKIRFIIYITFSVILIGLLILINNNYFNIHKSFEVEYIPVSWTGETYLSIFLFIEIVLLSILHFGYNAFKYTLPIVPYVIMLVFMTRNSPFPRISTQVVVWSIILLAFLVHYILINKHISNRIKFWLASAIIILFVSFYTVPQAVMMSRNLQAGLVAQARQDEYLQWVNKELPDNSVILAGGKSDLVTVGENINKPIVYSTLWVASVFIRPHEIPGVQPNDFGIVRELQNADNFKKKTYIILEDDIDLWRSRIAGTPDGLFAADPKITTYLHGKNYAVSVYKTNTALNRKIYRLQLKKDSVFSISSTNK